MTKQPTHPADAEAAPVAARATVPVLCWHQLRDWRTTDGSYSREFLICPPRTFRAQLDALAKDGWTTISPDRTVVAESTGSSSSVR